MTIYIIIFVAILCCALTAFFCHRYVRKAFNSMDGVLDRVLAKDHSPTEEMTDEKRLSKLVHKANRIMDMYVMEADKSKEEKETIQGFIGDMSHQMKTPLSGISMFTDLLLEEELTKEEQLDFLSRIKTSTEKLQWIMDNLIKMSRLETGAISLSPIDTCIKQTLADAMGSVTALATKKNVNISIVDSSVAPLSHDRKWTREAIANILENAIKYSKTDGEIKVSFETMPIYTKIIITDYGIGIEKGDWNLIFKRFYRGQNAKDHEGAGLGLYLAALIMEKQGGYIMIDSIPGEYTSFSLFFQKEKKS
jgi:signal transduction histidine kinase